MEHKNQVCVTTTSEISSEEKDVLCKMNYGFNFNAVWSEQNRHSLVRSQAPIIDILH